MAYLEATPVFERPVRRHPMRDYLKFYINGAWVDPVTPRTLDVQNPATEEAYARISIGSKADVDKAVAAAKAAFPAFAATTKEYRADLLDKIIAVYQKRLGDMAGALSPENARALSPRALLENAP